MIPQRPRKKPSFARNSVRNKIFSVWQREQIVQIEPYESRAKREPYLLSIAKDKRKCWKYLFKIVKLSSCLRHQKGDSWWFSKNKNIIFMPISWNWYEISGQSNWLSSKRDKGERRRFVVPDSRVNKWVNCWCGNDGGFGRSKSSSSSSSSGSVVEVGGNSEGLWGNRQHIVVVVVDDRAEALPTLPAYHGLLHHISSLSLLMLPSQVRWWCCYYYFYSSNAAYTLSTSKVKQRIFPEKS